MPLVFDQNTLLLLIAFLFAINIILAYYAVRNELRMKRMLKGKHVDDLEKSLLETEKQLRGFQAFHERAQKQFDLINNKIASGARRIGVVRFRPFGQKGGSQSFSAAFINEKGDGIVMSNLHVRDHVSLFAKELQKNESEHKLSKEEKEAITRAHNLETN
ncbi:hypothetical protein CL630_02880 [bacterium]|nr:hypothetical protein [bacterium]|tara:strand:- start:5454 stop:5933 length:480 start_codon:yes stop_codon:yes gene_type:complete